ncbi:MAG: hypothetical protein KC414_09200 [Romboutsia sp.]|nr:hypothetical protein [Romboutsia sp.]
MNFINTTGYLEDSFTKNNPFNIISSNIIIMKGVNQNIFAIPFKDGKPQQKVLMKPNQDYQFDSDYVLEIPEKNMNTLPKLQNGLFFLNNKGMMEAPYSNYLFNQNLFTPTQTIDPITTQSTNINPVFYNNKGKGELGLYGNNRWNKLLNVTPNEVLNTTNTSQQYPLNITDNNDWDGDGIPNYIDARDETAGIYGAGQPENNQSTINNQQKRNVTFEDTGYKTNFGDFLQDPAMLYDVDLTNALFKTGQSIGFNPDIVQNPEARDQARTGNTIRGVGAAVKSVLNIGRVVGAGLGYQNRMDNWYEDYQAKKRKALVGNYIYGKNGGLVQFLKNGGTIDELAPEKALTGEYITGLPKYDEDKANAEIEVDEYVKHPNGDVQKVYGKPHSKGGEKVNLESGTIVVSDNLKVGGDNAKMFRKEFDLDIKASDTFANVIDKYTKKIGLTKLNNEQEALFYKLSKEEETEDVATSNLNKQFLSEGINNIEEQKKDLEKRRSSFVDLVFKKQEEMKPKDSTIEIFEKGGMVKDKRFKELCKKFNIPEDKAYEIYEQYKNGGSAYDLPKYQKGGTEEGDPLFGLDLLNSILSNYSNDPTYGYKDIKGETSRINQALQEYGIDLPEQFKNKKGNYSQQDLDTLAGYLQKAVIESNPNIARDYGTNVAPTADGLNYLLSKGLPKEYVSKLLTANGKIKSGTKEGSLSSEDISKITDWAKTNLDNTALTEYAQTNFNDNKWYYRYPELKAVYYKDKEAFNRGKGTDSNLESQIYTTDKTGLYEDRYLLQDKVFNTVAERDAWVEANKDKENKSYQGYYGTDANDHIYYNPIVNEGQPAPDKTKPNNEQTAFNQFQLERARRKFNIPYLPDQSAVPPDSITPHLKIERQYERLDPVELTPEDNLKEIFRGVDFTTEQLNNLPDSQRRAALANLTANSQDNINKVITTIAAQNAANAQQTEQFNIGQQGREEDARANDLLNFEARQLTAAAKTQADLNNYFDFNRKVRLGNFNTVSRMNLLNDLFENYNISPFGSIELDETQRVNFYGKQGYDKDTATALAKRDIEQQKKDEAAKRTMLQYGMLQGK